MTYVMDDRNYFTDSVGTGSGYINYIWRTCPYSYRNCSNCRCCTAVKRQTIQMIKAGTDTRVLCRMEDALLIRKMIDLTIQKKRLQVKQKRPLEKSREMN